MPDVRIDNVSFTYPGALRAVLHAINLTIPEGQFVLLAGPSGCGKTTLALVLAGLIPSRVSGHLKGGIYFGEKNISALDIHEVSQNIGMVFQNPEEQLIHLDVEAEVAFGPENLALPRREIAQRVEESLTYTGMEQLRKQEIFALSGGQKQRVAISATLAMRPRMLVLDEPTSDLDPVGTQEVLRVLRALNKQYGMTIVLVEHKVDEVVHWVDRVLLMDGGRVVVDAPPRKAFDDIERWNDLGVSVPQMVLLARSLPDVFSASTPLAVNEVYDALYGTHYAQWLRQHNETMLNIDGSPGRRQDGGGRRQDVLDKSALYNAPTASLRAPTNSSGDSSPGRRQAHAPTNSSGNSRGGRDAVGASACLRPPPSVPPILSWEGVDLAYGNKEVLNDINLKIMPQEWVAVVGPNGSGKTSLASLALGFQSPTAGVIHHQGKVVEAGHISRQAEKIAYLFQNADTMLFGATVEQEILFGVKYRRKHKQQLDMPFTVDQLLAIVDLTSHRQDNPFHLSHGQRKRLAIGALLTRYPDVLILDEPTTGQDIGHARVFLQFLQQLRERENYTYVMITHNMEAVARYASRVVVLKDGRVFMDDTPEVVFAHVDELASCGILPPPIAQLHARLCEGRARRVHLSVEDFRRSLQPLEAML